MNKIKTIIAVVLVMALSFAICGCGDSVNNELKNKYQQGLIKVGGYITFGAYEQDNNIDNGKEDIEWLVLDIQDGKALVISKYALDCQQFNSSYDLNTDWEASTLCKWLNYDFIDAAFSDNEKSLLYTSSKTQDKVFLLSLTEANKYFNSDNDRKCKPTNYLIANNTYKGDEEIFCWWWLRTPGSHRGGICDVGNTGTVFEDGYHSCDELGPVRPALWINLK